MNPGRCLFFNMSSALGPRGDFRFMIHERTVVSDVFITFPERLLIGSEQSVFLNVDGYPVHKLAAAKRFIAAPVQAPVQRNKREEAETAKENTMPLDWKPHNVADRCVILVLLQVV